MTHPPFNVDNAFDSHPMSEQQVRDSSRIRGEAKTLAHTILGCTGASPQRSVALRKLQDVLMWSNKAIAENTEISR